ncbi:MAG: hypothetical protein ACRDY2_04305 [Acidimicrobiales bacterium]
MPYVVLGALILGTIAYGRSAQANAVRRRNAAASLPLAGDMSGP